MLVFVLILFEILRRGRSAYSEHLSTNFNTSEEEGWAKCYIQYIITYRLVAMVKNIANSTTKRSR